jgi:hypothetical protein
MEITTPPTTTLPSKIRAAKQAEAKIFSVEYPLMQNVNEAP